MWWWVFHKFHLLQGGRVSCDEACITCNCFRNQNNLFLRPKIIAYLRKTPPRVNRFFRSHPVVYPVMRQTTSKPAGDDWSGDRGKWRSDDAASPCGWSIPGQPKQWWSPIHHAYEKQITREQHPTLSPHSHAGLKIAPFSAVNVRLRVIPQKRNC